MWKCSALALWLVASLRLTAYADPLVYEGKAGPGKGKHIVFLAGDHEYRSEETLPALARVLAVHHGFKCTVLFTVDPKTGEIDPAANNMPGTDVLKSADLAVVFLRFKNFPPDQMQPIIDYLDRAGPIVGMRTATHAFQIPANSPFARFDYDYKGAEYAKGFGRQVLGETWAGHYGDNHKMSTRLDIVPSAASHPILRGVKQPWVQAGGYFTKPMEDSTILALAQPLQGMKQDSPPAKGKSPCPGAWVRQYSGKNGTKGRVFTTTYGASEDIVNVDFRRMLVNACLWGCKLEAKITPNLSVDFVGSYQPSTFRFDGYRRHVKPGDLADLKSPIMPTSAPAGANEKSGAKPSSQRAALPPSKLPLKLVQGERIAFVGNSTAERMNLYGHFESLLHLRFPELNLAVRNFGRPADEVGIRQRSNDYDKLDDPLGVFLPDTFLCFFGYNESFAGKEGLEKFKADYAHFLKLYTEKYPRDDKGAKPRFVLISPIAFESTGNKFLPDGAAENANLALYSQAVAEVAKQHALAYVDVFKPTQELFAAEPGAQYTINGCHVNERGDREVAAAIENALFGDSDQSLVGTSLFEMMREAVNDKSWVHEQDYRMLNGWYVYGGRRTWDTETFPREYVKIRNMAAVRDQRIWDIARGKAVPDQPDDSQTGDLFTPTTRFGEPRQDYSEAETLRYLTPDELIKSCTVPPGFEVKLFADETRFPELAKPVQMSFDNRGRLWVSVMPTYPQWKPGDPKPADKLLILEDTDHDGKADVCKTFYDKLHCPTGFEFFKGGVLVTSQPRMLWLKDSNGDDRADVVEFFLDGWATDDTHHTIGAFESNHGGLLHMLEGVNMSTTVETPWGPFRNFGTPGNYVLDPLTEKISHFVTPGYGNPWCYVFDEWGQGFVGDGTTANQHWDTPLSGAQLAARKGLNPLFNNEGMRPCVGSEFLISRNFPENVQGDFIYACVINMNGIPRFHIHDDGAGYNGSRLKEDGKPADLIRSTDKHFRPVDPQVGPDGALWFGDWANALIGHMQYSQRDPNRDHQRGRIYRLVYKDKPLVEPVTQFGKSIPELLEQFRQYEWRTRQRARSELRDRPVGEVLPELKAWVARLPANDPEHDRLLCEALWVQQMHHAVDTKLLESVLALQKPEARAAGTRVLADERDRIPAAFDTLTRMANDPHSRVRTEAIRGLSFYPTLDAVNALLATAELPLDYWTRYTLEHALAANEPLWRKELLTGALAKDNAPAQRLLNEIIASSKSGAQAVPYLRTLLGQEKAADEVRNKAIEALSAIKGDAANGRQVYLRTCSVCHKVGSDGREFGPELSKVATKLNRVKLVQSLIDPNAEVEAKFLSNQVVTTDGLIISGLLVREDGKEVVIFDGKKEQHIPVDQIDQRSVKKQSSMPDGLAATMAPVEVLDVIEYLSTLKGP